LEQRYAGKTWISKFFKMEVKKHGGARPNSGRLKKDEVLSLIETMDAITVPENVWRALYQKVLENDVNAIKLWLSYRFGMPKQTIDNNVSVSSFDITKLYDTETSEALE
jgi:hypothetical protein